MLVSICPWPGEVRRVGGILPTLRYRDIARIQITLSCCWLFHLLRRFRLLFAAVLRVSEATDGYVVCYNTSLCPLCETKWPQAAVHVSIISIIMHFFLRYIVLSILSFYQTRCFLNDFLSCIHQVILRNYLTAVVWFRINQSIRKFLYRRWQWNAEQ